ncbi:MAG: hypothetical protein HQK76_05540 [Desulfobacterales bacterium]|nr:hypothetical protein [Desulfobacterales bacterium]
MPIRTLVSVSELSEVRSTMEVTTKKLLKINNNDPIIRYFFINLIPP